MIRIDELTAATQLAPSVAPFTLRRLFLRARLFVSDTIAAEDLRRALPVLEAGLREVLTPGDHQTAMHRIHALLEREARLTGSPNDS